jgi:hypothetical protein
METAKNKMADWQSKKLNPVTLLTGIKGKYTVDIEVEKFIIDSLEGG